jgi:predicted ATPase
MNLKSITIENFKSFKNPTTIELKPITLLFGPNSCGKSTIIQALHYVRELLVHQNPDIRRTPGSGDYVDLGGFENLVHNHDLKNIIRLRFDFNKTNNSYFDYYDDFSELKDDFVTLKRFYPALGKKFWDVDFNFGDLRGKIESMWIQLEVKWDKGLKKPIIATYSVGINGLALAKITWDRRRKKSWKRSPLMPAKIFFVDLKHPLFEIQFGKRKKTVNILEVFLGRLTYYASWGHDKKIQSPPNQFIIPTYLDTVIPSSEDATSLYSKAIGMGQPHGFEFGPGSSRYKYPMEEYEYNKTLGTILDMFLKHPAVIAKNRLSNMLYLGPIREIPPRDFVPEKTYAAARWPSGLGAWDLLFKSKKKFIDEINKWIADEDKLNCGYEIEIEKYKEVIFENLPDELQNKKNIRRQFEAYKKELAESPTKTRMYLSHKKTGIKLFPQDLGIGISQFIPVIIAALYSKNNITAIEQPELHLHPALQAELGDLFIESALGKQKNIILIETHSEHLLLRMMRRMRETHEKRLPKGATPLTSDDIAVLYIENTDNESIAREMPLNARGELVKSWPGGFFEEGINEVFS